VKIRKANVEDAHAITNVRIKAWQSAYSHMMPEPFLSSLPFDDILKEWQDILNNPRTNGNTLVCEDKEKVVGVVSYGPLKSQGKVISQSSGEIYFIYVLPEFIRQGIGHEMLQNALVDLKEYDFKDTFLWVFQDNKNARSFYEKHGFINTEEKEYYETDYFKLPELLYRLKL
jgi:ribosomal protein S18 acetylase RimI-like enzyme